MLYHGVDLIELLRMEQAIARWGDRFVARVFTSGEQADCRGRVPSLAARWAAKEAVAKLLGVGIRGLGAGQRHAAPVGWHDIEVARDPNGRPLVILHRAASERAAALGIGAIALSLSHSASYALASAVASGKDFTSA